MRRRAFTLIELLMVILIMSLLLTLLVPGISAALRAANRSRCQSNLKAVGAALQNYFTDHQRWPQRVDPETPYAWDDAWYDQMFTRYLPNPKLLYCPDNNHDMAAPGGGEKWDKSWKGEMRQLSYVILDGFPAPVDGPEDVYNQRLGAADGINSWNITDYDGTKQGFRWAQNEKTWVSNAWQNEVKYPLARPLWSGVVDSKNLPIMGDLVLEKPNSAWVVNHSAGDRENPLGMNILYADGHATWVSPDKPAATPADRDKQRLWRRIWKGSGDVYVRWLVKPDEVQLPDKFNPRS